MNPFEMVIGIVAIVFIARVVRDRYRYMADNTAPPAAAETLQLRDEVQQLRERVQVLERVITDQHGRLDLDREIERLRDR